MKSPYKEIICPVCKGRGKNGRPALPNNIRGEIIEIYECTTCNGSGKVVEKDETVKL